jgi:hypothetical protein
MSAPDQTYKMVSREGVEPSLRVSQTLVLTGYTTAADKLNGVDNGIRNRP